MIATWKCNLIPALTFLQLRYFITLHPLSRASEWIKCHCRHLLLATWTLGAAYAYFPVLDTSVRPFYLGGAAYWQCVPGMNSNQSLYIMVNFALTFAIPLVIMCTSYVAITNRLRARGPKESSVAQFLFSTRSHRVALVFLEKVSWALVLKKINANKKNVFLIKTWL